MKHSKADYENYIRSDAWTNRRHKYFETHPRRCIACDSAAKIHLHHLTYDRMGYELDEDLMCLCQTCHSTVHRVNSMQERNMFTLMENTLFTVDKIKQGPTFVPRPGKKKKKIAETNRNSQTIGSLRPKKRIAKGQRTGRGAMPKSLHDEHLELHQNGPKSVPKRSKVKNKLIHPNMMGNKPITPKS